MNERVMSGSRWYSERPAREHVAAKDLLGTHYSGSSRYMSGGGFDQRVLGARHNQRRATNRSSLCSSLSSPHLQVAHGGLEQRRPVDHVLAAVDESLLVQLQEGLGHGFREALVESEPLAGPVGTRAQRLHLAGNMSALLVLVLPRALQELLAPHFLAARVLGEQLLLHLQLRRDAGVVRAGEPESGATTHAVEARENVLQGHEDCVAHVQPASDVGRRHGDRVWLPR